MNVWVRILSYLWEVSALLILLGTIAPANLLQL